MLSVTIRSAYVSPVTTTHRSDFRPNGPRETPAIVFQTQSRTSVNVASTAKRAPAMEYTTEMQQCRNGPRPRIKSGAKLPAIGRSTQSCRL